MSGLAVMVIALLAPSGALLQNNAQSVTGAWAGPLITSVEGKATEDYVHVVLRQAGAEVTGTAGPDADHQYPIRKGAVTSSRDVTTITFEFIANGVHSSFSLKAIGGSLKGDVRVVGEDGHVYTATAELKPVKVP